MSQNAFKGAPPHAPPGRRPSAPANLGEAAPVRADVARPACVGTPSRTPETQEISSAGASYSNAHGNAGGMKRISPRRLADAALDRAARVVKHILIELASREFIAWSLVSAAFRAWPRLRRA